MIEADSHLKLLLHHDWGWQPPQTASYIHIGHTQSVWAHWYAVHRHMVAALHTIILADSWLRFEHSDGSLGECKWCHYLMFEADIHIRPLSITTLDVCTCLSHWNAVSRVCGCTLTPFHQQSWPQIWESGSITEWKWCHFIMVQANILFKLLPTSIFDI